MSRISELKERAFARGYDPRRSVEKEYWVHRAVWENPAESVHNLRRAGIDCMLFDHYSIEIDPQELLAGRFSVNFEPTEEELAIAQKGKELLEHDGILCGAYLASTGHRVIDYEKLLGMGIRGVLEEIDRSLAALDFSDPEAAGKEAFYTASRISLEGVCRFAGRYEKTLIQLAEQEMDPVRRQEYFRMAENFSRAPYEPCTHFYEALQCMWFVQFCLQLIGDTSLTGRLDNYLWPYYKKDVEEGVITPEFAFELIENLYLKHNEIYGTWPASLMIGGTDRQGNPVWNELSFMCIRAIETTGLINPSVSVAYNEAMPEELLDQCVDVLSRGYTKPSIFNDRIVQEGLRAAGVSLEDSRYYVHSTCVEITPVGCSNILVATPYINLGKAVEYLLNGGKAVYGEECLMEPPLSFGEEDFRDFDSFYELVRKAVSGIIRAHLKEVCRNACGREHYTSSPLASAFLNDCLARGKDAGAGGAKYNFVYPCFPGFLNLVDTLSAVKTAVYDQKVLTLAELAELCRTNFEGQERLRQYLVNKCPKFGNGDEEADRFGVELFDFIRHELEQYQISVGGTFHPSYFAWIMHGVLGRQAAASPDGRKQGEALSECLGAVQGMDKNGPIGVMRSIEKLDQKYGIGGIATNFRFSKSFIGSVEGKKAVKDFIRVFMKNGCFEIQLNVVDQAVLLEAQKHPEQYQTLMVRVAGYSDYFGNLAVEIQNEIIKRSEHGEI